MSIFLCFLFFLIPYATACDRCVHQTKVSYFPDDSVLSSGACRYGSLALGFNGRYLAAGVPSLYKGGAGCGACFQMRCKNKTLCTSKGTKFILTDLIHNNKNTDFVLSRKAFRDMANTGMRKDILKLGVLDVEYKRIPCNYKHHGVSVRVEESSKKPDYLELKVLYQGGQTEIIGVTVDQVGLPTDITMTRKNGAVWTAKGIPNGPLQIVFEVIAGNDLTTTYFPDNFVPANWKPGMIYDSGMRIDTIKPESCPDSECDPPIWK